jgi:branched-chain amino acid transport system substrate-binding protein
MTGRATLVLAVCPALFLCGCSSKATPEPIWVGHVAQLSGPAKGPGTQASQGINLAVKEAAAAESRVLGRPLAVRHVDTHGDAETARAEAIRLIAVSKVSALLASMEGAQAERVGREALQYGVPVVVCGELASPPGENVFVLGAGPQPRGRTLARYASDELKAGSVAVVVHGPNAIAAALGTAFVQQFRKNDGSTVLECGYQNDDEFKECIGRVLKARPAAVLLAGSVRDCLRIRADLQAAKLNVPLLFGGEDGGATGLRLDDTEGPDLYLATAFADDGASDKGHDFARRFKEETGEVPSLAAALAYDGTRLLFDAMRQAGTANGARIREQLARGEPFESMTGNWSFKDRQAVRRVFVVRVKGGKATVVKIAAAEE